MIIDKQKNTNINQPYYTYINYYYENKKYYGQKVSAGSIKMQIRRGPINLRFIQGACSW